MQFDELSGQVIGCAIEVHKTLGPGLLESTYEQCLAYELHATGLFFIRQKNLPVNYKGIVMEYGYRIDFIIENNLIVELKSVDKLFMPLWVQKIHEAQILTYMRLAHIKKGLLINFNEVLLKNGLKRFIL